MVEIVFFADSKRELSPEEKKGAFSEAFLITALHFSGHALQAKEGVDVACAAISSAVFAYLDSIESNPLLKQKVVSEGRGNLSMRLNCCPETQRLWLLGVQSGLIHALNRVQKEYPKSVSIQWVSENKLD